MSAPRDVHDHMRGQNVSPSVCAGFCRIRELLER